MYMYLYNLSYFRLLFKFNNFLSNVHSNLFFIVYRFIDDGLKCV